MPYKTLEEEICSNDLRVQVPVLVASGGESPRGEAPRHDDRKSRDDILFRKNDSGRARRHFR